MEANKPFPKGIKTAILISQINDKHLGKKPEIIECKSAYELHTKLKKYLPTNSMPSYNWCLNMVKQNQTVSLIKKDFRGMWLYYI